MKQFIFLFQTLWIERTSFQCVSSFPGILRWFQVASSRITQVPPVQHACETMDSKNREIAQMLADPLDQPIQKLSLSLQGVIDAAVNGGIAKYQEAFFCQEYLRECPERADDVARLQRLMLEQVHILEQALAQHDRLISPEVRPLHEHLVVKWRDMRDSLQKHTMSHSPSMASTTASTGSSRNRRISRSASSRKGPLPPVPPTSVLSSAAAAARLSMTSMATTSSSSDGIYSQPASDSSSTSSAVSLMTVSLSSLPVPSTVSPIRQPMQHQSLSLNDPYQQIDKFDYVDASPVGDEAEGLFSARVGMVSSVPGMAPPLPPRSGGGVSPIGKGGVAPEDRARVSLVDPKHVNER